MDCGTLMQKMLDNDLSIREMAKILGMPKSTLHYKIKHNKLNIDDEFLLVAFDILMKEHKENMWEKGVKARQNKK